MFATGTSYEFAFPASRVVEYETWERPTLTCVRIADAVRLEISQWPYPAYLPSRLICPEPTEQRPTALAATTDAGEAVFFDSREPVQGLIAIMEVRAISGPAFATVAATAKAILRDRVKGPGGRGWD